MPAAPTQHPRRGTVVLAVLGLHGLLWVAARSDPPAPPPTPAAPPAWLLLVPAAPDTAPPPAPAPMRLPRPVGPVRAPEAITLPSQPEAGDTAPTSPATALPAATPGPAASAARPAPLDLRLPPALLRGDAPLRPRADPRPRSVESVLSRDLADGPVVEEDLGNGRRRFRQGQRCVEVRDTRMAQIDPFNQSVSPIPKQAEDCAR